MYILSEKITCKLFFACVFLTEEIAKTNSKFGGDFLCKMQLFL